MKRFLKSLFIFLFFTLLILACYHSSMIGYLLSQGKGQATLIWDAMSKDEAVRKYKSDSTLLKKIKLVEDVKIFAATALKLNTQNTFNSYYFPDKDTLRLRVINACNTLDFQAYQWEYPFIGMAPYKGFFDTDRLKEEYVTLKSKKLDIDVGEVEAWSTLGIISNPLMYSVLENSDFEIVEAVIHESVHATVFIKDRAEFNESFAEFIGEKGAELFLTTYGNRQLIAHENSKRRKKELLENLMIRCAQNLDSVYAAGVSNDFKRKRKREIIHQCCEDLFRLKFATIFKTKLFVIRILRSGNAIFSSYRTYHSKNFQFEKELDLRYKNDIASMILGYKKSHSVE